MYILLYFCGVKLVNIFVMTKENQEKMPISPTLDALAVGEMAQFPLHRLNAVKNTCSVKRLTHGFKFSTHQNSETCMLEVTRIL